jgi:hypothetical protein
MSRPLTSTVLALLLLLPATAGADIDDLVRCQRRIAREGAKFAQRVIRSTLKCTTEIAECQIQCEEGVFGPPCDTNPPPCCDPEDPQSSTPFQACMNAAQQVCDEETAKIDAWETQKRVNMTNTCRLVTQDELCGAVTEGLNFNTLNAGCLALDPNYVCTLENLVACVGGPLERRLVDQISATLHPRATGAVATLGLQSRFPDIPIARKVSGTLAGGRVDVWAITGQAGDEVIAKVRTRDDTGNDTSNLRPILVLLGSDLATPMPVADTTVRSTTCGVPSVCGATCPQFVRRLPFSGTFHLAVAAGGGGCGGGGYRLVVVSPSGAVPVLVADDAAIVLP